MCHPGKATTRAHGQQMSSGLIVRLRAGPVLLGTVEKRHRTARQGGRYKPFSREIAIWAVWAGRSDVTDLHVESAPPELKLS